VFYLFLYTVYLPLEEGKNVDRATEVLSCCDIMFKKKGEKEVLWLFFFLIMGTNEQGVFVFGPGANSMIMDKGFA